MSSSSKRVGMLQSWLGDYDDEDDDDDTRYEIMKMLNCLICLDGRKASLYLSHRVGAASTL